MALTGCPECKKKVSDSAKTCPHCGLEILKQGENDNKKAGKGCMVMFIAFAIIVGVIYMMSSDSDDSSSSSDYDTNTFLAYNYATEFVKKQLKSPSTAEFASTFEQADHTTHLGNQRYKISSWVDSQNSFGATIRTEFSCIIAFEGDEVRCENLELYE